ncbi:MAG: class I SAM-dependent methyltransferase [Acidimicrobiia bacterium]|nr:class I SAM-dependent methyltransferase [Acidimicrobiia bacterium]
MTEDRDLRLTGERPIKGSTPDSLLAFHEAGYREVASRLGPGAVLDVGCGVGEETATLAGPDRYLVGVDYSVETTIAARSRAGSAGPAFAGMDGTRLAFRDRSFDAVCSSHIVEHFTAPETHVAELARVLRPGGVAFVITPNRPADFENPFHVHLFEAVDLASLLRTFFGEVEVLGLEGDEAVHADFARRRAKGERLLRLDRFRLRHRVPRSWYVWAYERALPVVYRLLGPESTGIGSGLDASHFFLAPEISPATPGLFAVARAPR